MVCYKCICVYENERDVKMMYRVIRVIRVITSAVIMASRIAGVGLVTVSDLKSITFIEELIFPSMPPAVVRPDEPGPAVGLTSVYIHAQREREWVYVYVCRNEIRQRWD